MILTTPQLQKKCTGKNLPLYMAFFDLTKAFNTINRSILLHLGSTTKLVTSFPLLHNDVEVMEMTNGSTTDPFPIQTGIKQDCIITPTLFSIYLTAMLHLIPISSPLQTILLILQYHWVKILKLTPDCGCPYTYGLKWFKETIQHQLLKDKLAIS
eukprot:g41959.t1